jgi:hypothetical protein
MVDGSFKWSTQAAFEIGQSRGFGFKQGTG